jgi:hypothetical protein
MAEAKIKKLERKVNLNSEYLVEFRYTDLLKNARSQKKCITRYLFDEYIYSKKISMQNFRCLARVRKSNPVTIYDSKCGTSVFLKFKRN